MSPSSVRTKRAEKCAGYDWDSEKKWLTKSSVFAEQFRNQVGAAEITLAIVLLGRDGLPAPTS